MPINKNNPYSKETQKFRIFEVLKDLKWHCSECELPGSQPAKALQMMRQDGFQLEKVGSKRLAEGLKAGDRVITWDRNGMADSGMFNVGDKVKTIDGKEGEVLELDTKNAEALVNFLDKEEWVSWDDVTKLGSKTAEEKKDEELQKEAPFKSQDQRAWMHINEPEMAKEWEKETPKGKELPKKVSAAVVVEKK